MVVIFHSGHFSEHNSCSAFNLLQSNKLKCKDEPVSDESELHQQRAEVNTFTSLQHNQPFLTKATNTGQKNLIS